MVTEVNHFVADNDPEETRFTSFSGAAVHEERIAIANKLREHIEGLYGKYTDCGEITLAAYVELAAIVQLTGRPVAPSTPPSTETESMDYAGLPDKIPF